MEAALSTESAKRKMVEADLRRTKAHNNKFRAMLFGSSSERTDRDDGEVDQSDSDTRPSKPSKLKPNTGGAAATSTEAPKKRGMLGRQKVEIPVHLPREPRIIEPEHGACLLLRFRAAQGRQTGH